jgi:Protein of unknown function (DUF3306)
MVDRNDDNLRSDGFLSRWARRKQDVLAGKPVADPVAKPAVVQTTPAGTQTAYLEEKKAVGQSNIAQAAPNNIANEKPVDAKSELPPAPTLEDAGALTCASDFKPYMASNVTSEVKNAAMKKLFADPHYNVMDMMDTYVDDYSKPDPIPESMLKQLVSVKFLRLFERDEEEEGTPAGKPEASSQAPVVALENSATSLQAAAPSEALVPATSELSQGDSPNIDPASATPPPRQPIPHTP